MENYKSLITEKFNKFLFSEINLFYVGIFRILLAIIILIVFFYVNASSQILYTNFYKYFEIYDTYIITNAYLCLAAIPVILFGLGIKPRLFGFISVVLLFPLIFQYGLHISRQMLLATLLFFSFIKSDQVLSIKSILNKNINITSQPIWPVRLIQIQLSVLYLINAAFKSTPEFMSGEVLKGLSIMLPNFKVDLSSGFLDLGFITIPVAMLGIATVVSEYYLVVGFWVKKLRIFTAIFGIVFHIILKQVVDIGFLDYVAVFLYLAFLFPWDSKYINKNI
ncbi:MAG TPA: HTTM domain-containing protein [Thermodesulfobacteriota bacterium]|nr:HTTM domain-containing protein [Thermodesulfobacteriota bacterium]